jgi:hypothetical protein
MARPNIDRQREAEMDFDGLVSAPAPPPNRVKGCGGEFKHHLTEVAVIVAYAMHPLRTTKASEVSRPSRRRARQTLRFRRLARHAGVRKDETTPHTKKGRAISAAFGF